MVWLLVDAGQVLFGEYTWPKRIFLFVAVLLAVGMSYDSVRKIRALESGAAEHERLARKVLNKHYQNIVVQEMYAQNFLPYYLHNSEKRGAVQLHIVGTPEFSAPMLDSICENYDLLIMSNHLPTEETLRERAVDTSWYFTLWTAASCGDHK